MQELSYLGKIIILVSIWFRMVLIHLITRVYKDSLTLTNQYLIGITILVSTGRFFDTTIDVDY